MCNSEDEGDKRKSHAGTPPGINAEKASPHDQRQNKQNHFNKKESGQADMQGEGETGDRLLKVGDYEQGVTNLETRVKMLEEQIRGIYYKMGEIVEESYPTPHIHEQMTAYIMAMTTSTLSQTR